MFDFGHDLFELEVGGCGGVVNALPIFLIVDGNVTPLMGEPRVGAGRSAPTRLRDGRSPGSGAYGG